MNKNVRRFQNTVLALALVFSNAVAAAGYAFNETVPDVRLPASLSGGSGCPVPSRQTTGPGSIAVRWSTSLATNPVTLLTRDQTASGRLTEIAGARALPLDREMRRLAIPWSAERKMALIDSTPETLSLARAYADGINAYIDHMPKDALPLEFRLLGIKKKLVESETGGWRHVRNPR